MASCSITSDSMVSIKTCCFATSALRAAAHFLCLATAPSSSSFARTIGVFRCFSLPSSAMMLFFSSVSFVLASAHRVLACPKTNHGTFVFISAAVARNASRR